MALTLVHDCPHCRANNIGFEYVHTAFKEPRYQVYLFSAFYLCTSCCKPIAVVLQTSGISLNIQNLDGGLRERYGAYIQGIFPKPVPSSTPNHCPGNIGNIFIQAEEALARDHFDSSLAMDRRALELMCKNIAPEAKGNLFDRIEYLADKHLITPALKEWAHQLRQYGNDAVHEIDSPPEEDARAMHELTRFILTYIYTLPEQVRLAKEKREAVTEK